MVGTLVGVRIGVLFVVVGVAACSRGEASPPPSGAAMSTEEGAVTSESGTAPKPAMASRTIAAPSGAQPAPASDGGGPSPADPPCGPKPLPACTLRSWMKANTGPAMTAQDMDALATTLEQVATFAPAGYPNWASIARDGASAARALDLQAVRAACRSCHGQYKDRYKRELHDRPI